MMTTICVATDGETHVLAADGRQTWGDQIVEDEGDKLVEVGAHGVVALAGDDLILGAVRRAMSGWSNSEDICNPHTFARELETIVTGCGYDGSMGSAEVRRGGKMYPFTAAFITGLGAWVISSDLCVSPVRPQWPMAAGTGGDFAAGAMAAFAALHEAPVDPQEQALVGVEAGIRLDVFSGGVIMMASRGLRRTGPGPFERAS